MQINVINIIVVLFLWLSLQPSFAAEIKIGQVSFPVTKELEWQRSCDGFDISPDEHKMVFVVDFNGYFNELWTANLDGSSAKRLYKIKGADKISPNYRFILRPKYSPDGSRVGFIKTTEKGATLCIINLRTGIVVDILTTTISPYQLEWKDNTHIYFTKLDSDRVTRTLCQIGIDGDGMTSITSGNFDSAYPSPDGEKVCLIYRHRPHRNTNKGQYYTAEMLYSQTMRKVEIIGKGCGFQGHHPIWSPDSRALIFRDNAGVRGQRGTAGTAGSGLNY